MSEPEYELWAHESAPKVGWPWWMAWLYWFGAQSQEGPVRVQFAAYVAVRDKLIVAGWRRVP